MMPTDTFKLKKTIDTPKHWFGIEFQNVSIEVLDINEGACEIQLYKNGDKLGVDRYILMHFDDPEIHYTEENIIREILINFIN